MNKCIALGIFALVCIVAMTTAYGPIAAGGYRSYYSYAPMYPMHYGEGMGMGISGGMGGSGGGLFSSKYKK